MTINRRNPCQVSRCITHSQCFKPWVPTTKLDRRRLEVDIWDVLIVLAFQSTVDKEECLVSLVVLLDRAERTRRSGNLVNRVEWCACKFGVLGLSIQYSVALAEHRFTSTRKMLSASEMGTFSEPEFRYPAIWRLFAVFA